jgi:hypothetical protein
MNGKSERQERVVELVEQGFSQGEAEGQARAEQAGQGGHPAHGVDKPATVGYDRPA